ncbi:MAG: hypothetical protein Ta2D_13010 [Rickettsiales bacterium]|nr:MAG: hypothetical protein Ta2D_13010 [Rickettsiales bacterium]
MKRKNIVLSLVLSVLVLNLVGCGGSGGGGSPTVSNPTNSETSTNPTIDKVLSNAFKDSVIQASITALQDAVKSGNQSDIDSKTADLEAALKSILETSTDEQITAIIGTIKEDSNLDITNSDNLKELLTDATRAINHFKFLDYKDAKKTLDTGHLKDALSNAIMKADKNFFDNSNDREQGKKWKLSADETGGLIIFTFEDTDKSYNQSFVSSTFTKSNGVLTAIRTSGEMTRHAFCDTNDICINGKTKREAQVNFAKSNNEIWENLTQTKKDEFNTFWATNPQLVTVKQTDTTLLEFFGKTLPTALSYSNFGAVKKFEKQTGYFNREDMKDSYYFAYGDVSKERDLANSSTYTGKTFATAFANDKYTNLTGTATLDTNSGEKLTLAFDNYYTFETAKGDTNNINITGGTNGLGSDFTIDSSYTNKMSSVAWQGYGKDADASEVVGTFNFHGDDGSKNIDINGSFGAKK